MATSISVSEADCIDYVKQVTDGSVDLVLTDPPYGISKDTRFSTLGLKNLTKLSHDFGEWDNSFVGLDIMVKEFYRTLRGGGTCIIFYDLWKLTNLANMLTEAGFKQLRLIEWLKPNPVPVNCGGNYLTGAREIAVSAVKGRNNTFHSKYDNGVYKYVAERGANRYHPTQKPLALIEDLITKHSNPGDLVMDCFLGSGTTAIASINTKRRIIGCEASDEYFQGMLKRLNNHNDIRKVA